VDPRAELRTERRRCYCRCAGAISGAIGGAIDSTTNRVFRSRHIQVIGETSAVAQAYNRSLARNRRPSLGLYLCVS
jgi:hypothetical protein